jgi:hypothetical protein
LTGKYKSYVILDYDTSVWFKEIDTGDSVTYSCTYSDGTPRPGWIGYDTLTGKMRGWPAYSTTREQINLKFMATDTRGGVQTYYKNLDISALPINMGPSYLVLDMQVGHGYSYSFDKEISSPVGDPIAYSIESSAHESLLLSYGLRLWNGKNTLAGTPLI